MNWSNKCYRHKEKNRGKTLSSLHPFSFEGKKSWNNWQKDLNQESWFSGVSSFPWPLTSQKRLWGWVRLAHTARVPRLCWLEEPQGRALTGLSLHSYLGLAQQIFDSSFFPPSLPQVKWWGRHMMGVASAGCFKNLGRALGIRCNSHVDL